MNLELGQMMMMMMMMMMMILFWYTYVLNKLHGQLKSSDMWTLPPSHIIVDAWWLL
jgi:hypothetical protein